MSISPSKLLGASSAAEPPRFSDDIDSACSTPFVSAPSSPGHGPPCGYFFSAPASPTHFILTEKNQTQVYDYEPVFLSSDSGSFEFEFSSRFSPNGSGGIGSMTSADELFFNGQIRPMKLSSHLQRRQEAVAPYIDLYGVDSEDAANERGRGSRLRNVKYSHRKARSMSPLRFNSEYEWQGLRAIAVDEENETKEIESSETTPSCSASSSRSSSSGRNSRKWMFLKDLLNRSKSEGGRANKKERLWSAISFSSIKDKKPPASSSSPALSPSSSRDEKRSRSDARKGPRAARKPANGVWKRRVPPSAHELLYTANRAQAEEMKKKTFLPYRQGLFGCLGFTSKSYGAFSGFARNLSPISSRSC
ncbi:uncharacterized protein LOC127258717 [Andrographis paniculata]|uniref:uncharacterized protein LOC127258717 n=1 Tax=Andrographis paniculata TaxID=175694 RepID=UPI0021E8A0A8|nr:uncharacterized protein LOC127258717 [Andrographis paniculata]